jgi:2,4-dienoyl-CoA reductase (NADPH2)
MSKKNHWWLRGWLDTVRTVAVVLDNTVGQQLRRQQIGMRMQSTHESLFKPLKIGPLTLANRLVMGPVFAHSATNDGRPSDETLAFFGRRAASGVGLVIVGGAIATEFGLRGVQQQGMLWFHRDDRLDDFRRLTDEVHRHGVPVFAQINMGLGTMATPGPYHVAASPFELVIPEESLAAIMHVPGGVRMPRPAAATIEQIMEWEVETAASALRMKKAGFDGIEIGAHMSYFVASFLSPKTNLRTDEYGGSAENRARIVVNVVRRVRDSAGPDFVIGVRMSANEHSDHGQGPEAFAELARLFEAAGIDYVNLTDGTYESVAEGLGGDGSLIRHGEAQVFRQTVSVPIMLSGIHDPDMAAKAIDADLGDLIVLVRPLIADPDFASKLRDGQLNQIVRCNRENVCLKRLMMNMPVRCPVNPSFGNEAGEPIWKRLQRVAAAPLEAAALKLSSSKLLTQVATKLKRRQ